MDTNQNTNQKQIIKRLRRIQSRPIVNPGAVKELFSLAPQLISDEPSRYSGEAAEAPMMIYNPLDRINKELFELRQELQSEREKNKQKAQVQPASELKLVRKLQKQEAEKVRVKYKAAIKEMNRLQRLYDALCNSRTWRYTSPLRRLADLLKRLSRGKQ